MNRFAGLLEALLFMPGPEGKIRLLAEYLRTTPDPDRGWALAASTGGWAPARVKPADIRALALARVDADLFGWSLDFVGDPAETVALIWPRRPGANCAPSLAEIVAGLQPGDPAATRAGLEAWLDALDATGRWALLKLVTGRRRPGVSSAMARAALAEFGSVGIGEIEELWHALEPPYEPLFAWLDGRGERPGSADQPVFLPLMRAHPLDETALAGLDPRDYLAEWRWDGIRVQASARAGAKRLYAGSGDDVSACFPEIVAALPDGIVLDGALLVGDPEAPASFGAVQQRLARRNPTPALLQASPAFIRLFDALWLAGEDLRPLPLAARRERLERWYRAAPRPGLDLSPLLPFAGWDALIDLHGRARGRGVEGVMLKHAASPYRAGRPPGLWFEWRCCSRSLEGVLMYAQRSARGGRYAEYTFGVWRDGGLVPIGKTAAAGDDDERQRLERWVESHVVDRFGPVHQVAPGLVLEIAFDAVLRSRRHKAGLILRRPRIQRICWDKPAGEAARIETVSALLAE